jgi:hypothetical protein
MSGLIRSGLYNKFSNLSILQVDGAEAGAGAGQDEFQKSRILDAFARIKEIPESISLNYAFNM